MTRFHTVSVVAVVIAAAAACAQVPTTRSPAMGDTAKMDDQAKAMCSLHDKLAKARTPEERKVLMNEHARLMRDNMAMTDGMGGTGDMATRQQMMERRMDMMQCSMQMMMEQMPMSAEKR